MNPRAGGAPQSILSSATCRGLGFGVGCGLVFGVAFGFGCSAFAVVSVALFDGSRSVLVLPPRLAVVSLALNVGSRYRPAHTIRGKRSVVSRYPNQPLL